MLSLINIVVVSSVDVVISNHTLGTMIKQKGEKKFRLKKRTFKNECVFSIGLLNFTIN